MSDVFVPSTGTVSLSHIAAAFPATQPVSFTKFYGANTGIPASGPISLSHFRGKTAPRPAFTLTDTTGTNMTINNAGTISGTQGGTLTLNFLNFLTTPASFHRLLTFSINTPLPAGGTFDASGTLTVGSALTAVSTTRTLTVTNSWGKSTTIPLTLSIIAPASITYFAPGPRTNNSIPFDWSGTNFSYVIISWTGSSTGNTGQLTSSPFTVSGLVYQGTYTFTITPYTSSNVPGTTMTLSNLVIMTPPSSSSGMTNNSQRLSKELTASGEEPISFSGWFTGDQITYSTFATTGPYPTPRIVGTTVFVTNMFKGYQYYVTVRATNPGGEFSHLILVTEFVAPDIGLQGTWDFYNYTSSTVRVAQATFSLMSTYGGRGLYDFQMTMIGGSMSGQVFQCFWNGTILPPQNPYRGWYVSNSSAVFMGLLKINDNNNAYFASGLFNDVVQAGQFTNAASFIKR